MSENVLKLGKYIDAAPSIHQRSVFAAEVRRLFLKKRYSAVAVEFPPFLHKTVMQGISRLPVISMAVYSYTLADGESAYAYVPIDPCDSIIEALRLAVPERIPIYPIDLDTPLFENRTTMLPDEYAVRRTSLENYYSIIKPFLPKTPRNSLDDLREQMMGYSLRILEQQKRETLFVCGLGHLEGVKRYFNNPVKPQVPESLYTETKLYSVEHNTLSFLLGELPYLTFLYEKARASIDLKVYEETDGVKELLVAARDEFHRDNPLTGELISPNRLQTMITYIRNLCLVNKRMTPYLYEIITAAKGVGGSLFAAKVVELAKYYPYLDIDSDLPVMNMGIGKGRSDDLGVADLNNRLPGPPVEWRPIKLKRPPMPKHKQKWTFLWNPFRNCSWPPEDEKIESFHKHVRERTRKLLSEDQARLEKFTSSVKDGIDLRETIRTWHKNEIYVRVLPPSRGEVEIVVFIFDDRSEYSVYPWRTTWYAEHSEESTLALYGTNYLEDMVGPGVARAKYGGCFLLYPPRNIPDIWKDPTFDACRTPAERLTVAALYHSKEKFVTYVAHNRPSLRLREAARRLGRRLVFIPLSSFSRDTIRRLRVVHILNDSEVRSWASLFIRDPWRL